jgi:hypothetical protein
MTAREIGRVSLEEALALTILIAERAPHRLERVTDRWLQLYLEDRLDVRVGEAAFVTASLAALGDERTRDAAARALAVLAARPSS